MSDFQFHGQLYRNLREMHVAIAEDWLSGGGRNARDEMLHDLAVMSDGDLADEAIAAWDAARQRFDRDQLVAAFALIRANFAAHFAPAERS